jgi:hypothetical protein
MMAAEQGKLVMFSKLYDNYCMRNETCVGYSAEKIIFLQERRPQKVVFGEENGRNKGIQSPYL